MKTFYTFAIIGIALFGTASAAGCSSECIPDPSSCLDLNKCLQLLPSDLLTEVQDLLKALGFNLRRSAENSKPSDLSLRNQGVDVKEILEQVNKILETICRKNNPTDKTVLNVVRCIGLQVRDCILKPLLDQLGLPSDKILSCLDKIFEAVGNSLNCDDPNSLFNLIKKLTTIRLEPDDIMMVLKSLNSIDLSCLTDALSSTLGSALSGVGRLQ